MIDGHIFMRSRLKTNKYNARKTIVDGITFDSNAEANYYIYLRQMEKQGKLKILELQPKVYMTLARILIRPDFLIEENGVRVFIDVKGAVTAVFAIKKRLWKYYGAGILRIVKGKKIEEVVTV